MRHEPILYDFGDLPDTVYRDPIDTVLRWIIAAPLAVAAWFCTHVGFLLAWWAVGMAGTLSPFRAAVADACGAYFAVAVVAHLAPTRRTASAFVAAGACVLLAFAGFCLCVYYGAWAYIPRTIALPAGALLAARQVQTNEL